MTTIGVRIHHFADSVVDDQPAVPGQNRRSSGANLEPLPGRNRSRQSMMRRKPAQAVWIPTFPGLRTIGDPDTLPIEINLAGRSAASGLLGESSGKKGAVEHTQFMMPGGVRYCDGKQACILVVDAAQLHAVPMGIGCEPETLPVE